MQFGPRIMQRAAALSELSESTERLCRQYLSAEHAAANQLAGSWMEQAGMQVTVDMAGNLVGRYEGQVAGLPALLIGSHLDTVADAGIYDGMLGVLTGIECVASLNANNKRLPFAIEVIGFGDEEGVRFQATLLGSKAVAGTFDQTLLQRTDKNGISMLQAMSDFGLDGTRIETAAKHPADVAGYVEVHIEQGPVLELEQLPVGVVTSIAGASRFNVHVSGNAGHAGTVPMSVRRDALAGAAEMLLAVERICAADQLVGTVGQITAAPGAVNVIPGAATFSLDIRSGDDALRAQAVASVTAEFSDIAKRRRLAVTWDCTHDSPASPCDKQLSQQLARSIQRQQLPLRELPSGAGHDAMAIAALCAVSMLFVRCEGGISHHPDENMTVADADIATVVLMDFIHNFEPVTSAEAS